MALRLAPVSIRVLLDGAIDYAGLFPPAALGMAPVVSHYAAYRGSPERWMLGRLVVPAARLDELALALPCTAGGTPFGVGEAKGTATRPQGLSGVEPRQSALVTALVGPSLDQDVDRILAFNDGRHRLAGSPVMVDSVEARAETTTQVERLSAAVPSGLDLYVEIPISEATGPLVNALAATGRFAKVRSGGVAADLIPTSGELASFLSVCAGARLPFKATAGLHHPIRSEHPLTYEPGAPRATMHGFLNLLLATAIAVHARAGTPVLTAVLDDQDAASFVFAEDGAAWRRERLTLDHLRLARQTMRSFGSCSFTEPIADLQGLGLI